MRDLHVHSWHSGRPELPVLDLVTLTDHDTIEGALRLAHLPGTFVSEGSYARLTSEVVRIFAAGYVETLREALAAGAHSALRMAASLAMAPLLPLIPLFTLGVYAHERRFGTRHFRAFQEAFGWPALPWERRAQAPAASLGEAA